MPRGAKREEAFTKLLLRNKLLLDRRSFVGRRSDGTVHLFLKGNDMSEQRDRVIERANWQCQIGEHSIGAFVRDDGEMDHIVGGNVLRCDCLHNLRRVCEMHHRRKNQRKRAPLK